MGALAYRNAGLAAVRGRSYALANPELRLNLSINSATLASSSLTADRPFWKRDIVFTFIVISALTLLFCGTVIVGSIKQSLLPNILSDSSDLSTSQYAPSDKDSFLLRLNAGEQRKLAAQVHYVGELIRNTRSSTKEVNRLAYAIVLESRKLDIDPLFVAAVIKSESAFNKSALSYAGALGLMQLMPATAKYVSDKHDIDWQGVNKLKDPYYNIRLGVAYLKYLEKMFQGKRELMLIAYNWGPSNLNTALKNRVRAPGSTINYARTIINDHARWRSDFLARQPEFSYFNISNAM